MAPVRAMQTALLATGSERFAQHVRLAGEVQAATFSAQLILLQESFVRVTERAMTLELVIAPARGAAQPVLSVSQVSTVPRASFSAPEAGARLATTMACVPMVSLGQASAPVMPHQRWAIGTVTHVISAPTISMVQHVL